MDKNRNLLGKNKTKHCFIFFDSQGGRPPYVYLFDHVFVFLSLPEWIGVFQGADIPLLFGAPFKEFVDPFVKMFLGNFSATEKGLSLYMMKVWTDFAKYG